MAQPSVSPISATNSIMQTVLKSRSSSSSSSSDAGAGAEAERRKIRWDEATIAEHDKERGTRMKIDEPKTPYHAPMKEDFVPFLDISSYDGGSSSVILQPPPFRNNNNSNTLKTPNDQVMRFSKEDSESDDEKDLTPQQILEKMEAERKRKQFEAARKAHYNEVIAFKQLKNSAQLMDEDDDD